MPRPMQRIRATLRGRLLLTGFAIVAGIALVSSACSDEAQQVEDAGQLTIYSGRGESLVGPLIERFEAETGITVRVRYAGTAELAAAILEEGDRSPADVYYAQDAGALAALAEAGALTELPEDIVGRVPEALADAGRRLGRHVGTGPRAGVLARACAGPARQHL